MPLITEYQNDARLRAILQGPPGSGKTTLACQFPKAWVMDLDVNLSGALRFLREQNLQLPVGYDIVRTDASSKPVDIHYQFLALGKALTAAVQNPDVETIILDSATNLHDMIIGEVLRSQNKIGKPMAIQDWGFYMTAWKSLIGQLTAARKHLILVVHEEVEKDEIDQTLRYFLAIPGKMKHVLGALFTDVWRCEVTAAGFPPKYKWSVRTMPDTRFQLKNSLGLPAQFEFSWKTIEEKLKS